MSHNPVGMLRGSQYKSAIWFANEVQHEIIKQTIIPLTQRYERELTTQVLPFTTFYNAEDYHQKYILQRNDKIMKAFSQMYPIFQGIVDSTAASRLNGFSAGQGKRELFDAEKESYGLDPSELEKLFR